MLTMIMKAREERDRMLEQIEENERNGGQQIGQTMSEDMEGYDPNLAKEIQKKRQFLEKLKQQV